MKIRRIVMFVAMLILPLASVAQSEISIFVMNTSKNISANVYIRKSSLEKEILYITHQTCNLSYDDNVIFCDRDNKNGYIVNIKEKTKKYDITVFVVIGLPSGVFKEEQIFLMQREFTISAGKELLIEIDKNYNIEYYEI